MERTNIERSILSSFFFSSYYCKEDKRPYLLDPSIFKDPLRKRCAEKINESEPYEWSFLSHKIEESLISDNHKIEWVEILGCFPMSLCTAKLHHDDLVQKDRMEEIL